MGATSRRAASAKELVVEDTNPKVEILSLTEDYIKFIVKNIDVRRFRWPGVQRLLLLSLPPSSVAPRSPVRPRAQLC